MPIVSSWDGVNRRIYLDSSVINSSWKPLDLFKEYLTYRRDNEQFRGFSPLVSMKGGEPKGGGDQAPRFLQMLTDNRGITTKVILPNLGPYRTKVDGEILTDVADVDPEPFDVSNLTTAVIIDYKPPSSEVINNSSGVSIDLELKINEIHRLLGLDLDNPVTITKTSQQATDIDIQIGGDGVNTSTLTRQ